MDRQVLAELARAAGRGPARRAASGVMIEPHATTTARARTVSVWPSSVRATTPRARPPSTMMRVILRAGEQLGAGAQRERDVADVRRALRVGRAAEAAHALAVARGRVALERAVPREARARRSRARSRGRCRRAARRRAARRRARPRRARSTAQLRRGRARRGRARRCHSRSTRSGVR